MMMQQLISGRASDEKIFPSVTVFRRAWKKVREAAGVSNKYFHSWRRTSAREKRDAGVDSTTIMEMSGWRTNAMPKRYSIVDLNTQRAALRKLGQISDKLKNGGAGNAAN